MIFRNKKTKNLYKIKDKVINTTNAQDGQIMILYEPLNIHVDKDGNKLIFVREQNEFYEKFEEVDYSVIS